MTQEIKTLSAELNRRIKAMTPAAIHRRLRMWLNFANNKPNTMKHTTVGRPLAKIEDITDPAAIRDLPPCTFSIHAWEGGVAVIRYHEHDGEWMREKEAWIIKEEDGGLRVCEHRPTIAIHKVGTFHFMHVKEEVKNDPMAVNPLAFEEGRTMTHRQRFEFLKLTLKAKMNPAEYAAFVCDPSAVAELERATFLIQSEDRLFVTGSGEEYVRLAECPFLFDLLVTTAEALPFTLPLREAHDVLYRAASKLKADAMDKAWADVRSRTMLPLNIPEPKPGR